MKEISRVARKLAEDWVMASKNAATQAALNMESRATELLSEDDEEWCIRSHNWLNEELPAWAQEEHRGDLEARRRENSALSGAVQFVGMLFCLRKHLGVHSIEELTSLHRGVENLHSELRNLDGARWSAHLDEWWGRVLDLRAIDEEGFALRRLSQGVAEVHKAVLAYLSALEVQEFQDDTGGASKALYGLDPSFEQVKTVCIQLTHVCRTHAKILAARAHPGRATPTVATASQLASQRAANVAAQANAAKGKAKGKGDPANAKGRGRGRGKGARGGKGGATPAAGGGGAKGRGRGGRQKRDQPCFQFRDTGSCEYGDTCIFTHGTRSP